MRDVENRADLEQIVRQFYQQMLADPIIGFIFTEIAQIELEAHIPIIVNFWSDVVLRPKVLRPKVLKSKNSVQNKKYFGNVLQKHLELNKLISLKPGHFTRWLYLFGKAVDASHAGSNAELMKDRAELVAKAISGAILGRKKGDINLSLSKITD